MIYVNEKTQNPKLKQMLAKYASVYGSDKKAAVELLGQIADELTLRAKVISPVTLSEEPVSEKGRLVAKDSAEVTFTVLNGNESDYLPIFTDHEEFEKWSAGDKPPYSMLFSFDACASVLESNGTLWGLVINPFSDNLQIPRKMALNWFEQKQIHTRGHARHVITDETPTEVYAPDPYPMQLSNKLCETAKGLSGVNALWLRQVKLNGSEGYLLIADLSEDGNKVIFPTLGEASKPFLNGFPLHIVTADNDFGKNAIKNVLPIYTKNA